MDDQEEEFKAPIIEGFKNIESPLKGKRFISEVGHLEGLEETPLHPISNFHGSSTTRHNDITQHSIASTVQNSQIHDHRSSYKMSKNQNDLSYFQSEFQYRRQFSQYQNTYLYVISGYCDSPLGSVERLVLKEGVTEFDGPGQTQSQTWQRLPDLPTPRTKFQSVVVNKFKLYQD